MEKDSSEIAKLTERIAKDPKSKLFVPLAEEHKKAGNIEMAVSVLQEGLRNNPSYVTARSFLGRLLMETGDLAGAQKELEEVIKSIPDNLLAQRKLADLYAYQGRGSDALQRYRAALALNPGDKEIPSLIADLEAGKDIAARLPGFRAPAPAAEAKRPQQPVPAPVPPRASAAPAAKPTVPSAAGEGTKSAAPAPKAAPKPQTPAETPQPPARPAATAPPQAGARISPASGPAPAAVSETAEPVEDIIELEAPPQTGPAAVRPPATTQPPATAPMPAEVPAELKPPDAGAAAVASFDLSEPNLAAPAQPVSVPEHAAWEPPAEAPREAAAPGQAAPVPSGPAAAPAEPTDDINTSTLAELYITQGFFEKAIEIYEGMLAEHPGNAALQQKLEKIRAMAGVAERNAAFAVPAAGPADAGASADVFAAARRQEAAAGSQAADAPVPEPALRPAAEERPAEQAPPAGRTAPRAPQASAARRKETIDRLESWLKNVIKEKP